MTESLLFWVFALATCGGAIGVVVSQRVVRMAFWLVVSLGSVSGLFFLLHADFVAATQLLIYVGGTVVLLIFGVMLTASGSYLRIPTSAAESFQVAAIGLMFLLVLASTVTGVAWPQAEPVEGYNPAGQGNTLRPMALAFLGARPDKDLADMLQPIEDALQVVGDGDSHKLQGDGKTQSIRVVQQVTPGKLEAGKTYRIDFNYDAEKRSGLSRLTLQLEHSQSDLVLGQRLEIPGGDFAKEPTAVHFYVDLPAGASPAGLSLAAELSTREGSKKPVPEDVAVTISSIKLSHVKKLSAGYLLPFEIVSVHLLVVLIGAAYLARAKRRVTADETA